LGNDFWASCRILFFGSALASLTLAPFILLVLDRKRVALGKLRYGEAALVAAGLVATTYLAFRSGQENPSVSSFWLYLPVPFLLWGAMRFGLAGASGFLLSFSGLSFLVTRLGSTPFYSQANETGLLSTQLSLFFLSVPLMFLSLLTSEQRTQLEESAERFQSLVDVAPVMLWVSGLDGRCTFFNKTWLKFTGLSLKQQLEQDFVACIHPEDRERCVNRYLSAFKSRENFTMEYRLLRHDGVYRWVLHHGAPRYGTDGGFLGYIGSRFDFTDRREAEEHLRKVTTQLLNAQEIESCRIGYELHENLAQYLWALSIRLGRFSREYAAVVNMSAVFDELQQQLRNTSVDIARLSHQLRPTTVGGLALSTALHSLCHEAADDKRAVFFVQSEDLPPLPDDVSQPLFRIAQESLQNALAHSGATYISIELSASATMLQLSVRDNGCGFVVESNSKLGLGLSAMSERMRSAGGGFKIISNPGEGTSVIATMPLSQSMHVRSTA